MKKIKVLNFLKRLCKKDKDEQFKGREGFFKRFPNGMLVEVWDKKALDEGRRYVRLVVNKDDKEEVKFAFDMAKEMFI